ncbi:MAG: hypothetical protein ACYTGV_11925 [Planctomycetota bacterium]|jgi:hypothetical protein
MLPVVFGALGLMGAATVSDPEFGAFWHTARQKRRRAKRQLERREKGRRKWGPLAGQWNPFTGPMFVPTHRLEQKYADYYGFDPDEDLEESWVEDEEEGEDFGAFWHKKAKRKRLQRERTQRRLRRVRGKGGAGGHEKFLAGLPGVGKSADEIYRARIARKKKRLGKRKRAESEARGGGGGSSSYDDYDDYDSDYDSDEGYTSGGSSRIERKIRKTERRLRQALRRDPRGRSRRVTRLMERLEKLKGKLEGDTSYGSNAFWAGYQGFPEDDI